MKITGDVYRGTVTGIQRYDRTKYLLTVDGKTRFFAVVPDVEVITRQIQTGWTVTLIGQKDSDGLWVATKIHEAYPPSTPPAIKEDIGPGAGSDRLTGGSYTGD